MIQFDYIGKQSAHLTICSKIRTDPGATLAHLWLGDIFQAQGKYDLAVSHFWSASQTKNQYESYALAALLTIFDTIPKSELNKYKAIVVAARRRAQEVQQKSS